MLNMDNVFIKREPECQELIQMHTPLSQEEGTMTNSYTLRFYLKQRYFLYIEPLKSFYLPKQTTFWHYG